MYAVCTHRLTDVIELPFLRSVPTCFALIAIGAWSATFIGLVYRVARFLTERRTGGWS
jgi:hypothetical protein